MVGLSEVTPGPIAINMATFIGSEQGGFLGATIATIGVILPAFLIMLIIAIVLRKIMKNKFVQGTLGGIKSVAVALIASSAITLLSDILFPVSYQNGNFNISANLVSIKIFVLIIGGYFILKMALKKKPTPVLVIIMSVVVGLMVYYL